MYQDKVSGQQIVEASTRAHQGDLPLGETADDDLVGRLIVVKPAIHILYVARRGRIKELVRSRPATGQTQEIVKVEHPGLAAEETLGAFEEARLYEVDASGPKTISVTQHAVFALWPLTGPG